MTVSTTQPPAVYGRPDGRARDKYCRRFFPFPALDPVLYADLLHWLNDIRSFSAKRSRGTTNNPSINRCLIMNNYTNIKRRRDR